MSREFTIYDTYYDNTEDIDPYHFYDCYGFFPNDNEQRMWDVLAEENAMWRESEEDTLGRIEVQGSIYAVRDYGGYGGAARIPSLPDILGDVTRSQHNALWYVKNGELWGELHHHDETVYTRYRLVPDEAVLNNMFEVGAPWEQVWQRASVSLAPIVCKAYGLD